MKSSRTLTTLALVSSAMAIVVAGAQPAAALDCDNAPPPFPSAAEQAYTVPFGASLRVKAPGLLSGATGTGIHIETSWQGQDQFTPSDDLSFQNAIIRYGNPTPAPLDRNGGFTYTPDPDTDASDAYSGIDTFNYTVEDVCGQESDSTPVQVTIVPVVVNSSYIAMMNTPLDVSAATGFLSHDEGVDPGSLQFDLTSAHGGDVNDSDNSDGSFVYTPPPGFAGIDTFQYTVMDRDQDNTYPGTVTINVEGPPAAPAHVSASASGTSATVSWSAPANHGKPITGYQVTASPGGRVLAPASSPVTFNGLSKGVSYTFKVRARNVLGLGPSSAASNAVTISTAAAPARVGYWMLSASGKVFGFGDAAKFAAHASSGVAIAPRRDGKGYWTVDAAGNVSQFGAAANHGGNPPLRAGEVVSTISATPSGNGYWLFTNRGRAFAYGDAHFKGDLSGTVLNGPIVASVATPTGNGYYMVGSDGGVFSFGDARFHGSTGGIHLNKPIVGISPTANNAGYWLVASDGGVFAFNAPFRGSMGGAKLSKPVNGLVGYGNGYLMVASDGGVFDFSNKSFLGSLAANPPASPIIGIAAFSS